MPNHGARQAAKRWGQRLALMLSLGVALAAPRVWAHNFVGAQQCANCHAFAYQVWANSPHARAHVTLSAQQRTDSKCTTCHTNPQDTDPKFAGVQCEQCHGAGKVYQPAYVMKDRELSRAVGLLDTPPSSCLACHTSGTPTVRPFDYAKQWAAIDHSKQARLAWERAQVKPVGRLGK
jgi:hypothetical protein